MTGTHDFGLTVLSVLIAMVASYTALDLAARVVPASGRWAATAWLGSAAVTMGGGIWSMHFVAMLAFSMPGMEALYDPVLTVISLLLAVGVTGLGFAVVAREGTGLVGLILSGLVMGLGIVGMHYTGMAAMRIPVTVNYDAFWVSVSVLVAIGASTASLRLAFQRPGPAAKIGAAIAMGLAISGMHFAGMQAASFHAHHTVDEALGRASIGQTNLALAVSTTTFLILFLALIAAMFDRRFAVLADKEAKALRRSEEQFRALYRNTPLPLHALNKSGELEEVSEAWLGLLGYQREEVMGRSLAEFMTEESALRRMEVDWPLLMSDGGPIQREYKLLTKAGAVLEVISTSKVERDPNGQFVRVIGGLNDITARRRAEEALHQAQKMEAVGQLTGGIAHDFNNMLAGILGGLELLQKRLDTGRLDDTQRFIDAARTSAQRAAALTQRLLAFGRRQSLDVKAIEVEPLLRSLEDLLERTLGPDIRLSIMAEHALWPAKADASQLESAVLNLAINARDAMPEGGELSIRMENGEQGSPSSDFVVVSVGDTGTGMTEEVIGKAFDPFFTTKPIGQGTGLGLSMVYGFMNQIGGRVDIDSELGRGTTIRLMLPRAPVLDGAPEAQIAGVQASELNDAGAAILVVEDDSSVRLTIVETLKEMGCSAIAVGDAKGALPILEGTQAVDLLITDVGLPGMNGRQLADFARQRRPELKVLFVTGYAEGAALRSGFLGTGMEMLSKPFAIDELSTRVRAMIEQ